MIGLARDRSSHSRLVALGFGLALVAFAGAATLDVDRTRFLSKSPAERDRLRESLLRFDMRLTPEEQRSAKALDARLGALPDDERDEYLIVLRRYHNWLQQLPERLRDSILADPPDRRLKRIQELAAKYPPPDWRPSSSIDFLQVGGTGIFELAGLCKAWLSLSPADRKAVDGLEVGRRKEELARRGRDLKIPRELRPADFDEAHWMEEVEARFRDLRSTASGPRDWLAKIEARFEAGGANADALPRARPFLRRLAENLYVEERPIEHPVDPARLEQFFVAIPSWIQSTFGGYTGDEARRRLTMVYRLVYPHPEEFRPAVSTGPSVATPTPKSPSAPPPATTPIPKAVAPF